MEKTTLGLHALINRYAPVIRFMLIFLGSYILLAFLYDIYLEQVDSKGYYPDMLTHLVAIQSEVLVNAMGYTAEIRSGYPELTMHLLVNGKFVARIVEGCNAASIMTLFVSFMLAFFGKPKPTIIYILAGLVFIYVTNVLRIALMAVGIFEYPAYAHFLHAIAFPLVIYGSVFALWVLWIYLYAKQGRS